jgi:hypothetical protein
MQLFVHHVVAPGHGKDALVTFSPLPRTDTHLLLPELR